MTTFCKKCGIRNPQTEEGFHRDCGGEIIYVDFITKLKKEIRDAEVINRVRGR